MIYELTNSFDLPFDGKNGDLAVVNENGYKRHYVWKHGSWRHERDYVCPVNASDLHNEPNV